MALDQARAQAIAEGDRAREGHDCGYSLQDRCKRPRLCPCHLARPRTPLTLRCW
jgi:hypothetical protein